MSCLFDSIAALIGTDGSLVRKEVCDYLEKNGELICGMKTKDVLDWAKPNHIPGGTDYISHMRKRNSWGSAVEIQCACNIWNVRIHVRDTDDEKWIEFQPVSGQCTPTQTLRLVWYRRGHYEPWP